LSVTQAAERRVTDRYGKRDTDNWIEDSGLVVRLIPDDVHGSRHQRFILSLRGGQTILLAHNLELSAQVPVGIGDRVKFRGMYEWNEEGGLVHWTHGDPLGLDEGGYVEFRTRRYS
jgi:hypothetical protein